MNVSTLYGMLPLPPHDDLEPLHEEVILERMDRASIAYIATQMGLSPEQTKTLLRHAIRAFKKECARRKLHFLDILPYGFKS